MYVKKNNLRLHLDGARVFNALVENNIEFIDYAKPFDSISICLSKGLGAPVGSLLLGSKDFIRKAHRVRKVLGGGMRQTGIIAGGGLYALKHNIEKLKIDHKRAKLIETTFQTRHWVNQVIPVETNIIVVELIEENLVSKIVGFFKNNGILCMPFGKKLIRMVTHLDIDESDIEKVIQKINEFND